MLDHATRHRGREQRAAVGHDPDGVQQRRRLRVLEQEAAGARAAAPRRRTRRARTSSASPRVRRPAPGRRSPRRAAPSPSSTGIRMSQSTTSGRVARMSCIPARPSAASPTSSRSSSDSISVRRPVRTSAWSSTTSDPDHRRPTDGISARTSKPAVGRARPRRTRRAARPAARMPPMPRPSLTSPPCPSSTTTTTNAPARSRHLDRGGRRSAVTQHVRQRLLHDEVGDGAGRPRRRPHPCRSGPRPARPHGRGDQRRARSARPLRTVRCPGPGSGASRTSSARSASSDSRLAPTDREQRLAGPSPGRASSTCSATPACIAITARPCPTPSWRSWAIRSRSSVAVRRACSRAGLARACAWPHPTAAAPNDTATNQVNHATFPASDPDDRWLVLATATGITPTE